MSLIFKQALAHRLSPLFGRNQTSRRDRLNVRYVPIAEVRCCPFRKVAVR